MKIVFGVMSSRYELDAKNIKVGKLAMSLYFARNIPIAIYSPKEIAFSSLEFLKRNDLDKFNSLEVQEAYESIKKIL